jgi:hypothetical protein
MQALLFPHRAASAKQLSQLPLRPRRPPKLLLLPLPLRLLLLLPLPLRLLFLLPLLLPHRAPLPLP